MIIFDGTKIVGEQTVLVFKNEEGKSIDLVFNAPTTQFILQNFERLNPAVPKPVEYEDPDEVKESIRIFPKKKKVLK